MSMIKPQALRTMRAVRGFRPENSHAGLISMARYVTIRSVPVPPVSAYDEWLASVPTTKSARRKVEGRKLHRAVLMRRNGSTVAEAARAVGVCAAGLRRWLSMLPEGLAA